MSCERNAPIYKKKYSSYICEDVMASAICIGTTYYCSNSKCNKHYNSLNLDQMKDMYRNKNADAEDHLVTTLLRCPVTNLDPSASQSTYYSNEFFRLFLESCSNGKFQPFRDMIARNRNHTHLACLAYYKYMAKNRKATRQRQINGGTDY